MRNQNSESGISFREVNLFLFFKISQILINQREPRLFETFWRKADARITKISPQQNKNKNACCIVIIKTYSMITRRPIVKYVSALTPLFVCFTYHQPNPAPKKRKKKRKKKKEIPQDNQQRHPFSAVPHLFL